jgi:RNA-dependent RNA polymerase
MVLEDRGVRREAFEELQDMAVADARTIDDSIDNFCKILSKHYLGHGFHLEFLMKRLECLNLDLKNKKGREAINDPFLSRVRQVAMNHVLRDIKHGARIPVPNSWLLVGVADEGPAYQSMGYKSVYCLPQDKIYGIEPVGFLPPS